MYIQPHIDYCDTIFDCHLTAIMTSPDSKRHKIERHASSLARLDGRQQQVLGQSSAGQRRTHRVELYHKIIVDDRIPIDIKSIIPQTRATVLNRVDPLAADRLLRLLDMICVCVCVWVGACFALFYVFFFYIMSTFWKLVPPKSLKRL